MIEDAVDQTVDQKIEPSTDSLLEARVLVLDCQTTGMRPSNGSLLEIAWAWVRAADEGEPEVQSFLCALPEGATIPGRVSEITGINDSDLHNAVALDVVREALVAAAAAAVAAVAAVAVGFRPLAVIHYAQFERPFIEHLLGCTEFPAELPFDILCSHHLSKRLFPNLPSRNIRGVSGFFAEDLAKLNGLRRMCSRRWRSGKA